MILNGFFEVLIYLQVVCRFQNFADVGFYEAVREYLLREALED